MTFHEPFLILKIQICLFRVHILGPRKICNIKRKPMTRQQTGRLRNHDLIPDMSESMKASGPAVRPVMSPIDWVMGDFFP
jgi:hypothetical protein